MSYQYDFDHTSAGDLRLAHRQYEILHRAYRLLRDELSTWNQRVAGENGAKEPYMQETSDLDSILKWGERQLRGDPWEIVVRGISVGSLRDAKAALMLDVHQRRQDRAAKSAQGWPDAALRSLDDALERTQRIADDLDQEPSEVLRQLIPRNNASRTAPTAAPPHRWDVYAELLLDYDACVHAAHATSGYLRRRNLPSNGADHLSREIRIAIANIPRSAMAVAKRLRPGPSEASQ